MEPPFKRQRRHETATSDQVEGLAQSPLNQERCDHTGHHFRDKGFQNSGSINVSGDWNCGAAPEAKQTSTDRKSFLESLEFDQIDSRQASIKKAFRNTCRWFLQTPVYKEWENKDPSLDENHFLWIKGKPGAGKSTLMKFLYQHLQPKSKKANNVLISFFFNARGHDLEKSTVGLYRSLLFQLLEKQPDLLDTLNIPRRDRDWDIDSLKSLFEQAIEALEQTPVICLVDALDECDEEEVREMVGFFADLVCTEARLSICFASRHYPHITIDTGLSIILENQDKHQEDIATYLGKALRIGHDQLAEKIRLDLQQKASGVFMWVVLVVDILNKEFDAGRKHTLRDKVKQLPANLHELFRDILTRDNNHQGALLLCIQWVLFTKRPLTPKELYFAILSGYEPKHLETCHSGDISDEDIYKYILNNSKGVVESTKGKTTTIQFIHESVRDFLLKEGGLGQIFPALGSNIHGQRHDELKQCCIAYMNASTKVEAGLQNPTAEVTKSKLPFLEYAIYSILYHAEKAESKSVSQLEFLAQFPRQEWIRHRNGLEKHKNRHYTPNASLSYILAEFDTPALIRAQPSQRSLLDVEDERYGLPILAAMATKSCAAVQAMLEIEAEQSATVSWTYFQTLIPASREKFFTLSTRKFNFNRKRGVEDQLLEHPCEGLLLFLLLTGYIHVDTKDHSGRGLPELGTLRGYHVLLKEFLNINPSFVTTDRFKRLLLHAGVTAACTEVVKQLIEHGADVSIVDNEGGTLLHRTYSPEMTKQLIEHGADVKTVDNKGKTPLHYASESGKVEVAKRLIEHGADVSVMDDEGKTPLHYASSSPFYYEASETVKQLIEHGADISVIDNAGKTPLHYASSQYKGSKVVKRLIEHGADVSIVDNAGKTPLHCTADYRYGDTDHLETAKQLIEHGADVSIRDKVGKSPLDYAMMRNNSNLVKLLQDIANAASEGQI